MKIRPAVKSDAASLAALSIEVWIGTYLRRGVNSFYADFALSEFTTARFETLMENPKERFMVSENLDGIDGYIRLTEEAAPPVKGLSDLEISTFYVQPRHHGSGIGSALLEQAVTHADRLKRASIWLTTNSENTPAIEFYISKGFRHVGTTDFRIHDQSYPNHVLSLDLDEAA